MSAATEDRALNAVRRLRDSREQDSRFGVQHALGSAQRREADLAATRERRASAPAFTAGGLADFAQHVALMSGLVAAESQAVQRVEDSRLVADEATRRWQHDRQQLRVVDLLLERRAAVRAEERARHEAHELDDLATQVWLRNKEANA